MPIAKLLAPSFSWLKSMQHLLLPQQCIGCGSDQMQDIEPLCHACNLDLPRTYFESIPDNPVEKIFHGRLDLKTATSLYYFNKDHLLQELLHQLKYQGQKNIGINFGNSLGDILNLESRFQHIECIIPMPMVRQKEKKRGYNQAVLIAQGMASNMQLPVLQNAVVRTNGVQSQTGLNRMLRWENVKDRYVLKQEHALKNRHVLLVDDVVTTGATLESCGLEILRGEPASLSIATIALASQ
jgi:ComF family protein